MAVLPTYNNLEQKSQAFDQILITEKSQVDNTFLPTIREELENPESRRYIYRGVANANYKIYSSAQRSFIEKGLQKITGFDEMIAGSITKALEYQNELLRKYFTGFNIPFDLPVLSFLQQYGAPTPLIDWTYNVEVAMFFATDGLIHDASNTDIDNYFSIYSIDKDKCHELQNISQWLSIQLGNLFNVIELHPKSDATKVLERLSQFNYDTFRRVSLFYISDFERYMNFPALTTQSNLNIINQEGLYIFNASSHEPLEDFFVDNRDPYYLPKIRSFDIHKSLYYYVHNKITEVRRDLGLIPLNRDFIYPQEEEIAKNSFINYLKD